MEGNGCLFATRARIPVKQYLQIRPESAAAIGTLRVVELEIPAAPASWTVVVRNLAKIAIDDVSLRGGVAGATKRWLSGIATQPGREHSHIAAARFIENAKFDRHLKRIAIWKRRRSPLE
jgi:hypothetical protein